MRSFSDTDATSRMNRVRLRVTKLMGLTQAGPAAPVPPPAIRFEQPVASEDAALASHLSRLAEDVRALQLVIEDTEELIRRGWDVAMDLNDIRHRCRCEAVTGLSQAIGFYQGLLNQCRRNMHAATKAIASIETVARTCQLPEGKGTAPQALERAARRSVLTDATPRADADRRAVAGIRAASLAR